jgi:uncharacterized protein
MSARVSVRLPLLGPAQTSPAPPPGEPSAWHRFDVGAVPFVLVVDGSRIYELPAPLGRTLDGASQDSEVLDGLGIPRMNAIGEEALGAMPLRALSLAVAQKCNLGCSYCYADGGDFGDEPRHMSGDVAKAAIDGLLDAAAPGERVQLSFLGGEPLANRGVLVEATEHASRLAESKGVRLGLSITTNGTLLTEADGEFFERHAFAVTVSLDGVGAVHDRLRPFKNGRGSYERIVTRVQPLLKLQRRMQVSARVTVTPENLALQQTLDEFISMGFHSVGFSPMLASPTGREQMQESHLQQMLSQMVECGRAFELHVAAGRRYPFSNMATALQQIHRGTHRPYPCGAGAGYVGVSAEGELHPCHRFVGDAATRLGSVYTGVEAPIQAEWLRARHVHAQQPCSGCWARYLCGGGCHHEVLRRGRPACDYIRGWLDYCLQAYVRLSQVRPAYFGLPERAPLPRAATAH